MGISFVVFVHLVLLQTILVKSEYPNIFELGNTIRQAANLFTPPGKIKFDDKMQ